MYEYSRARGSASGDWPQGDRMWCGACESLAFKCHMKQIPGVGHQLRNLAFLIHKLSAGQEGLAVSNRCDKFSNLSDRD